MTVTDKAYAKINLYLDVLQKRQDGYHEVLNLMQKNTLCDVITVSASKAKQTNISLYITGADDLPADSSNLVWQAARLFLDAVKTDAEVEILLEKRIPSKAGLGGGSSDCATTLRILNEAFDSPLSFDRLCELGARLGSDVPFFFFEKPCLCSGRGEIVVPSVGLEEYHCVIVAGDEGSSTAQAYRLVDELPHMPHSVPDFAHFCISDIYNSFTPAISSVCPSVAENIDTLRSLGAIAAEMSGSGSAVFGLFDDKHAAASAQGRIGDKAFLCKLFA